MAAEAAAIQTDPINATNNSLLVAINIVLEMSVRYWYSTLFSLARLRLQIVKQRMMDDDDSKDFS
jgi:hypothetical protein